MSPLWNGNELTNLNSITSCFRSVEYDNYWEIFPTNNQYRIKSILGEEQRNQE